MSSVARVRTLYSRLLDCYGAQGWWPLASRAGRPGYDEEGYHPGIHGVPREPIGRFEVATGAVLTQNTAWRNVQLALAQLRRSGVRRPADVLSRPTADLAAMVRPSGAYRQKARKLRLLAALFAGLASGEVPTREALLHVWGIGPETADSILLYAFHRPLFVVDAYTRRLLSRMGIVQSRSSYGELQGLFHRALGPDHQRYGEYHALIVRHAKVRCRSRPRCGCCPVRGCLQRA